ncbi:MAG TPA: adenylate/guanylate cyclase domain-containing protein [Candidatus Acidoferrales bacterium]|jgi:class 3 adenylate cyclase/tetratricopeptide (TPR) repeat protein|nr:adenylate/guanylate cyclase domain-containing protein [Candidatus Acidoferrales bacterium]
MSTCPQCGDANPDRARFCLACGAALTTAAPREARKTVTVLFSDMVGSTELGDRLDPESIRRVVSRYFDTMQAVLERHGGTVEKFIGDAIMAVFGIPNVHEDDALRALRSAHEMRERLQTLNEELAREWGVRLRIRTGVNTGEVVAGDPSRGQAFVSGDTVNVAARLEQAAAPDEILIGERTWRLGAGTIEAEPVAALVLKGKPEPLPAWRLLGVSHTTATYRRRGNAAFVGRGDEVEQLGRVFERVSGENACVLATIVGPPGIGKSRLADEFRLTVGQQARVVTGHCLPYGEGITYWPLAEIVNDVAGNDLAGAVAAVVEEDAPVITERIAAAVGTGQSSGSPAEIFWAFRKLFEGLARERPLIVVIDDLHWAEPTLLDLLEYVIGFASGVPLMLLCQARAELFESRPSWAVPRRNAVLIPLQPISEGDARTMIEQSGAEDLSQEARARVAEAAEGNPLFIEQLLALNADAPSTNGAILVPPTIQALLAARIDRLDASDRAVIERAAIEGRSFHRGAVVELLDEDARGSIGGCLISLARKEFIQPDQALFSGDDGFRFGHILIRDAAYEAVPKQLRAELHERFATWLERITGDRAADYDEILGYHLEQAQRYQSELGRSNEAERLAILAGTRLAAAGSRAQARGDMPAAVGLLTRATRLLPAEDSSRLLLLSELAAALIGAGELAKAETTLREADERARIAGNELAVSRAMVARLGLRIWTGSVASHEMVAQAEAAVAAFDRLGDDLGLARSWHLIGLFRTWGVGDSADADDAFRQALLHARRAGARLEESQALQWMLTNAWFGSTAAAEGIRQCQEVLEKPRARTVEALAMTELACFWAMGGKFDEAWASFAHGLEILEDLGQQLNVAGTSQEFFDIAMLAGDPAGAEARLRSACEMLERMGNKGFLGTRLGCLAEAVYAQGRFAEAEQICQQAEITTAHDPSDIDAQFRWRMVRAKVLAQRGEFRAAESLARDAVSLIAATDWPNARAGVQMDLAEILQLAGRGDEARVAVDEALRLYEAKENLVAATQARARLAALSAVHLDEEL